MRRSCSASRWGASVSAATKGSWPGSCSSMGDLEDSCFGERCARAAGDRRRRASRTRGGCARTRTHGRNRAQALLNGRGQFAKRRAEAEGKGEGVKGKGSFDRSFFQSARHAYPHFPLPLPLSPFPLLPFSRGGDAVLKDEVRRVVFEFEEVCGGPVERGPRNGAAAPAGGRFAAEPFGLAPHGLEGLMQVRPLVARQVHRDLHDAAALKLEAERLQVEESAVALAHGARDAARDRHAA